MSSTEITSMVMKAQEDLKELRSFGLIVGGIFGVIGLWPMVFRGGGPRWWPLALSLALLVPALAFPRVLAPVHRLWMRLADVLAWINTRILLSVVFFGVVTPIGLVMRFLGRDPMRREFDREAVTYRVGRRPRPANHMTRLF